MKLAELLAASEMQLEAMERQGEKDRQEAKKALWKATADQQENHKKEVSLLDQQIQVLQTCVFEKMSQYVVLGNAANDPCASANKKTNEEIEQQAELLEDQDRQLEEYAEALKDRDQEITRLNGCIEKLERKLQSKNNVSSLCC